MTINNIMDDEEKGKQVIMKDGKPVKKKQVLDELLHKKDGKQRDFAEG